MPTPDALSTEDRSLLQRLHDSARVSGECSRRHDGAVSEMFAAMSRIFEEAAHEIERLYRERGEDTDRMERAAETIERLNAECNQLAGLRPTS